MEADEENPRIIKQKERISAGGKVFNYLWYGSIGLFIYNYYLYKSKDIP